MKIILTQIILLLAVHATAQPTLDFGNVVVDSNFNCNKFQRRDSIYYGIEGIGNSKSEMEIRLYQVSLPGGRSSQVVILSYGNGNWKAKKIVAKNTGAGVEHVVSTFKPHTEAPKDLNDLPYKNLFDTLKANDVFTLPDDSTLNYEMSGRDGGAYRITFKVNNSFRSYNFNNPKHYAIVYPEIKAFKKYSTVAEFMLSFFGK